MAPPRWLIWHRRDLRLADNLALAAAAVTTPAITGVFFWDPAILEPAPGMPKVAPARLWFWSESLKELERSWEQAGSRLLILRGKPSELLPLLAAAIGAQVVAWNRDVEPYARDRDRAVAAALQAQGTKVLVDWDQLLIPPDQLTTGSGDPYRVYGPFWRNWRGQVEARWAAGALHPSPPPADLLDLDATTLGSTALTGLLQEHQASPSLDHGFGGMALCPCRPGEAAAQEQLHLFCQGKGRQGALLAYGEGRNIPSETGTSGLSAALAFGTLSPRQAWAAAQAAKELARSDEARQSITVWEQELAWREFYQQALFHFPELAEGPYRPQWRHFPWENDLERLAAWRDGLTGMPIIDAAMRQLTASGWMHNRCRMIVASYLVKDLICNWQLGEAAFMEHLVDGDLAANNGGWQWSASSGMDPKPLRIFNPATQAAKFDPDATYIRTWLPELAHVSTKELISGEIAPLERRGYPDLIVDHKHQQAHFKALYATIKG
jgi:deoxyribodipyrimidine photo-lyase